MSRRLDVLTTLKAMIVAALPDADVLGLDNEAARPRRTSPGGLIIIRSGDPGEPDVDLNPLTYWFTHPIPIEVSTTVSDEHLDQMLGAIGAAITANRTLLGLCDWLEPEAPLFDDIAGEGTHVSKGAAFNIVATYSTTDPLN